MMYCDMFLHKHNILYRKIRWVLLLEWYYNIKKLDKINIDYSWIENNNESVKKQVINAENHFKKLDEFLTKGV